MLPDYKHHLAAMLVGKLVVALSSIMLRLRGMELDLIDVHFDLRNIKPRELEEAFEDPFSVRFLPDNERADGASRFYALGRTVADRYLFFTFTTDGKTARIVAAREMSETERRFYDRKYAEVR
jgi:uncharacterized DUF497 family protein